MRKYLSTSFVAAAALALAACGGETAEADGDTDDAATGEAASEDGGDASASDAAASVADGKPAADGDAEAVAGKPEAGGDGEAKSDVDFGDDNGEWANDGECDDPRFEGSGMTETVLLDDDIRHDATDCREAFERGDLTLR